MIFDVRKLKPGDVIVTNNKIEPPCLTPKNIWTFDFDCLERGMMLIILRLYEKKVGKNTRIYCDVLHDNKKYKIYLLEYGDVNLPKDMKTYLYATHSFTKVL